MSEKQCNGRRLFAMLAIFSIYRSFFVKQQVRRQNVTGLQWLASEAWTSVTVLQTPELMPYLAGTIGIAIRHGEIKGLKEFLLQIRPDYNNRYGKHIVMILLIHSYF